ncbi:hypothetical protein GYH30_057203 [Glycine max]|nr:hypothetical protein GYH30_057203 [Glycine max]
MVSLYQPVCAGGVGLACIWGTSPVLIPYMLLRKGRIVRGETGALVLADLFDDAIEIDVDTLAEC